MEKVENFRLKFEKKVISPEGNEEIIYFVYAIEIKLSIISLYHQREMQKIEICHEDLK
jgi:hypothetical protein